MADSLASAEAVLTETEKELGVAVADIGAGTIDLALFADGSPFHTSVLPVGGNNVTMDIAAVMKTSLQVAEDLKINHGTCDLRDVDPDEMINVEMLGEEAGRTVSRLELCQVIEARMRETFELAGQRDEGVRSRDAAGRDRADRRRGAARRGRRARPRGPPDAGPDRRAERRRRASSTTCSRRPTAPSIGLLRWGAAVLAQGEPSRYESAPAMGGLGRLRDALRSIFP